MKTVKTIFHSHISIRQPPKNMEAVDLPVFESSLRATIKETTVRILKNASILKNNIFSPHYLKFYTSEAHIFPISKKKLIKSLLYYFKPCKKIDKGIWLTDEWSSAYFHWLTDALTRFLVAENFGRNHLVIVPEEYQSNSYIAESLALLNISPHYYNKRERLKIKELILPSHTALAGSYNKIIINQLRDRFVINREAAANRKIYISREKAERRKILNEGSVQSLLIAYGYEIHFFEDYSLEQQIAIMTQTKFLIGLHGAGLTNMLFMQKGAQILELRNKDDDHNNCFFALASDLDHNYYFLPNIGSSKDTYATNITVDISQLRKVVDIMHNEAL